MNGYVYSTGRRYYFLASDHKIICKSVIDDLIEGVAKYHDKVAQVPRMKTDEKLRQHVKYYTGRAYLYKVITATGYIYYVIGGDNWQAGIPCADFYLDVVLLNIDESQITVADNRGTVDLDYARELTQN